MWFWWVEYNADRSFSRLRDTVARLRTGMKFSPRYENRGKLTHAGDTRAGMTFCGGIM